MKSHVLHYSNTKYLSSYHCAVYTSVTIPARCKQNTVLLPQLRLLYIRWQAPFQNALLRAVTLKKTSTIAKSLQGSKPSERPTHVE